MTTEIPKKLRSIERLPADQAARMAEVFSVLADPTRVRILYALSQGEETTGALAGALGISDSAVSHQLRTLRHLHLIASRREGKQVWHRLADDHVTDRADVHPHERALASDVSDLVVLPASV